MAPEVQKGHPRRRQFAEESKQSKRPAWKTAKCAVKAPTPKVHITVPPPKGKNSADAVDESHAKRKRVKVVSSTPEPSSIRYTTAHIWASIGRRTIDAAPRSHFTAAMRQATWRQL